jgi:6-pyruvoyltetrahydropterin/6-carboxytetrahydropterin synthase
MEMYRLQVKGHFDAAHQLKDYPGKCKRLHGHRWDVELCLEGEYLDNLNMLVDFTDVKKWMKEVLDEVLDHNFINEVLNVDNPTAEFLAYWLYQEFTKRVEGQHPTVLRVARVCVWESPECCVKYSPDMKATGE